MPKMTIRRLITVPPYYRKAGKREQVTPRPIYEKRQSPDVDFQSNNLGLPTEARCM